MISAAVRYGDKTYSVLVRGNDLSNSWRVTSPLRLLFEVFEHSSPPGAKVSKLGVQVIDALLNLGPQAWVPTETAAENKHLAGSDKRAVSVHIARPGWVIIGMPVTLCACVPSEACFLPGQQPVFAL